MTEALRIKCPSCKELTLYQPENPFRPFCSKQCKIMDTAAWADGSYKISRTLTQDDEEFILENYPSAKDQ